MSKRRRTKRPEDARVLYQLRTDRRWTQREAGAWYFGTDAVDPERMWRRYENAERPVPRGMLLAVRLALRHGLPLAG